ncbi:MAG TPA: aminopeptidase [Desulfovibrio sp.]|uniref:DUF4910 domain-containing protein n=2 Tax=Nitratidesulfovibrio vulgaris TaxID=881 RepID=UPI000E7E8471|nr:DUF4910 domain-containing protein [Nitratidesulfovibrio vulgaris]HBW15822.1 aminopeptidase [Desulfovibrio sp.]
MTDAHTMQEVQVVTGSNPGQDMYKWACDLFPVCRSLTGDGVRTTLDYLGNVMGGLGLHEIPSGTACFDWNVPDEWNIRSAFVMDENGNKVIDFARNNLHVVGYSEPVDVTLSLDELQQHLHSLEEQPDAIPYVTSYYRRTWGFCLSHNERMALRPGNYRVVIDSTLAPGFMTYGDVVIPGRSEKTVLLTSYVCHPSMANNELSGPVLLAALARLLRSRENRLTYRLILVPETIGTIYYLSRHLEELKRTVIAGFVLSCVGDDRDYSYLPSRRGNTLADRVLRHVLDAYHPGYSRYTFLDRASDERQYNSPGVDLPVIPFARSLYRRYPEYHTSLDDLSVISPEGLQHSFETMLRCIDIMEGNQTYKCNCLCEPQLGKRGLYPTTSVKNGYGDAVRITIDSLAYCDGQTDVLGIAEAIGIPADRCIPIMERLAQGGVLSCVTD